MARPKRGVSRKEESNPRRQKGSATTNGDKSKANGAASDGEGKKKQILLNAFDMCTIGYLRPGQWKNPKDRSAEKRSLKYWINLAKILEKCAGGMCSLKRIKDLTKSESMFEKLEQNYTPNYIETMLCYLLCTEIFGRKVSDICFWDILSGIGLGYASGIPADDYRNQGLKFPL